MQENAYGAAYVNKTINYYDKIYLYSKHLEPEKYALLSKTLERIAEIRYQQMKYFIAQMKR